MFSECALQRHYSIAVYVVSEGDEKWALQRSFSCAAKPIVGTWLVSALAPTTRVGNSERGAKILQ